MTSVSRTLSEQLVPGAAKIYLSGMNKGEEIKVMDMDAEWGNDRASVTFREPQPMLYTLDFSVDTTGQTVKVSLNSFSFHISSCLCEIAD